MIIWWILHSLLGGHARDGETCYERNVHRYRISEKTITLSYTPNCACH